MKYLLCELDDEHYTEPAFTIYESKKEAFTNAVASCMEIVEDNDFQMEVTEGQNRVAVDYGYESFYVTEIKEFDSEKGDYILVWHHAYNGVNFAVLFVGTYEECVEKRREEIKKIFDERDLSGGDNKGFDMENDDVVDTGDEWEMFNIISVE